MSKTMNLLANIFKNLFWPPATRMYPAVKRADFEQARGHVEIDISTCIFCGLCARKCPANALTVEKASKAWTIDPYRCIICSACVDACPKKCLSMNHEQSYPVRNPDARSRSSQINP